MNTNQTSEAGETPSQTIYLLMTETVDVGGIVERFARDAYMNRTDAEAEKAKLEAGDKEREAKRMAAGRSCGAVYSYTIDECELIGSATESHLRAQLAEAERVKSGFEAECTRWILKFDRMLNEREDAIAERDAAQARVGEVEAEEFAMRQALNSMCARASEMEGLLRECLPWLKFKTDLANRIDAALATSTHRLAGRGE